jgi:hypothetical protein
MKPSLTKLVFVSLILLGSVAQCQVDSSSLSGNWRLDIEGGVHLYPGSSFNDSFGLADWKPGYSVRVGIGTDLHHSLSAEAFLEYRHYLSTTHYGDMFPWVFARSFARREFALYASLTAFGFLQAGIGVIEQSHEEIVYYETTYEHKRSDSPQTQPAASRVKLFSLVGLKYDISLGAGYYIPIGVYIDMFLQNSVVPPLTLRFGISKTFD